jgi:N-acetyl-gamma-glutamyl-phosphate reductase
MTKIFIDGSAGTTGLRIRERLSARPDLHLISLPEELRKDPSARRDALDAADIAFLCLPDAAAVEAVSLASADTVIIDTSTAHRTAPGWVYGFPELTGYRDRIRSAKRIANPGCHASGFIALVFPLMAAGLVKKEARLSCFSLTGYSGGGKKMIAEYEAADRDPLLSAPRQYGLAQAHKHLPEMAAVCGLAHPPVFCPIVAPYYAGMEVTVPLTPAETGAKPEEIAETYREFYRSGLVRFSASEEGGFLSAGTMAGRDDMEVSVFGNEERMLLVARFDNLGKGASGAAIQNMNLALGLDEKTGLVCAEGPEA